MLSGGEGVAAGTGNAQRIPLLGRVAGDHRWGDYPLDELTKEQRSYVLAVRDVNALNAAYAGRAEFRAEGLPAFEEVFPEIAAERKKRKKNGAGR